MLLSDLVGIQVHAPDGNRACHLVDLAVELDDTAPVVTHLGVRRHRRTSYLPWAQVAALANDHVELVEGAAEELGDRAVLLRQDVLDTQVIDLAGKKLARVADVLLTWDGSSARGVGVEIGAAGVCRRLGMRKLARHLSSTYIDWSDLHLTASRVHAMQLSATGAGVHRLGSTELAAVVAHLSTDRAAEVIEAVSPDLAATALSATHPRVGARLLNAVSLSTAAGLLDRMPADDAVSTLRRLPDLDLLQGLGSERQAVLRRLLDHPAGTAGGLMNSEVITVPESEPVSSVRDRVAEEASLRAGRRAVIAVDDAGRPVGSWESRDLLSQRPEPRRPPVVPSDMPVQDLIDLFTVHDDAAMPVVDPEGRLLGIVTADDILDELLAERLPGQGRYRGTHRHRRPDRRRP